jgi:hypothetical protein
MGKKGFFSAAKRKRELAKQEKKKRKAERREAFSAAKRKRELAKQEKKKRKAERREAKKLGLLNPDEAPDDVEQVDDATPVDGEGA